MSRTTTLQPWDEVPMRRELLKTLQRLPRERLDRVSGLPPVPGCYLQFFATPAVEPILGKVISTGRYPAYLGVASSSLRERLGRYRQSTQGIAAIRESDIFVAVLPMESAASAAYGERAGIELLGPPLQLTGWGSRPPGSNRKEQSPVDALFPGRRWATPTDLVAQAAARLQVLTSLIRLDPSGPRWSALPQTGADVETNASKGVVSLRRPKL